MKAFSFTEMVSNNTGKTSASGFSGVIICLIGALCFLIGSIAVVAGKTDSSDILIQSIGMVYAGALLLGYRKSADKAEIEAGIENAPIEQEHPNEDLGNNDQTTKTIKTSTRSVKNDIASEFPSENIEMLNS